MVAISVERQRASRDPPGLFGDQPIGRAPDRQSHVPEPDSHGPAKFDLAAAGFDRLTLQKQQDEASIGTIRDSEGSSRSVDAALDEHGQVVPFPAPHRFCRRLVRQGGEGKARIGEPELVRLFAQDLIGRFDQGTLVLGYGLFARRFDALLHDQAMDISHGFGDGRSFRGAQFGVWSRELLEQNPIILARIRRR